MPATDEPRVEPEADDELAEGWVCPQPTCRFRTDGMSLADRDAYERHQAWHRDRMLATD